MVFISIEEPSDKFHTLMSLLDTTISLIALKTVKELNLPLVATPKCLALNLPHPSFNSGFILAPSTIIEVTIVPCR